MSLFPLKIRFLQKGCLYYLTKFNKNNLVKGGLFYYLRHFCWDNEKVRYLKTFCNIDEWNGRIIKPKGEDD